MVEPVEYLVPGGTDDEHLGQVGDRSSLGWSLIVSQ